MWSSLLIFSLLFFYGCDVLTNMEDESSDEGSSSSRATLTMEYDIYGWNFNHNDSKGWIATNNAGTFQPSLNAYVLNGIYASFEKTLSSEESQLSKQATAVNFDFYISTDIARNAAMELIVYFNNGSSEAQWMQTIGYYDEFGRTFNKSGVEYIQIFKKLNISSSNAASGIKKIRIKRDMAVSNGSNGSDLAILVNKVSLTKQGSPDNRTFNLFSKKSGLTLDNANDKNNGGRVHQWQYYKNLDNQHWKLVPDGNGYYYIISEDSGLALDNTGSMDNGGKIHQWQKYIGHSYQLWKLEYAGAGYYNIVCKRSGKALDNTGGMTNGTKVHQWTNHNGYINQLWSFQFVR